jgi:membrane-bound lytic murein transglycosylase B
MNVSRRHLLKGAASGAASLAFVAAPAFAQVAAQPFAQWVETFRARALAKGISEATYARVMGGLKPDTTVFTEIRSQPEFNQQLWQYLNRRVSDWRIQTGQERAKTYAPLLARIEKDFGVERGVILGLWGHRVDLRRSGREAEPLAPGLSRRSPRSPGVSRAGAPIGRPS